MEFGMFHEFPSLPGRTESEAFDEAMGQVDVAERLGLDVMWLAELHFEPRRSVLSAPLSIASAIAARTRRMKIGIAVQVLPLCHPLRLAEEAATVDQVSQGRLIFGVGRSGVVSTYDAYQAAGHPGKGQVFVSAPIYIAETEERARAEAEASVTHFYRLQYELIAESARRSGRQNFIERAEKLRNLTYADALRGNVLVGTPESVATRLKELRDEIGFDGILAELNCGGLIPHDRVLNALRLLCQEVMPRFASTK